MGWPWKPDYTDDCFCSRCLRGASQMFYVYIPIRNNENNVSSTLTINTLQGPICTNCYTKRNKKENDE